MLVGAAALQRVSVDCRFAREAAVSLHIAAVLLVVRRESGAVQTFVHEHALG
jgi:hypothetical protein